ncbi:hypothetical protein BAL199_20235 [alpha proteobacterium BAL199]|nr:hypothetical protein BAL199_20235 [alpha proteobacterium BAL199]
MTAKMTTTAVDPIAPKPLNAKGFSARAVEGATAGQVIDVPYTLWLATLACALMAILSLTAVTVIYGLDAAFSLSGRPTLFGPDSYLRVLELAALFGAGATVAHFLRLRLEAIRRASILVPLPYRITVSPPGGDTFSKFECSCKVTLALDHDRPLAELKLKGDILRTYLENAFVVAVTDPVIRFSRLKIEQTLKSSAYHVLGDGVSGVIISELRQRRVPAARPVVANNPEPTDVSAVAG